MGRFAAIILAAGQGKRMRSPLPKVLHRVGGRPLLEWVVETARAAGAEKVVAVLGVGREQVQAALPAGVESVVQEPQLGTGHAARCTEGRLKDYAGPIAVLSGDVPLLRAETVRALAETQAREGAAVAVLTARVSGPHAYGRVVRDATGQVTRIVEHKDANAAERAIDEINTGTYVFGSGELFPALAGLRNDNAQGEYYLTDAVAWLAAQGKRVAGVVAPRADECLGINTPEELVAAEQALKGRSRT
jgi:bifunctional UDP-N-acetylglucosamine pyrophosphorylase / glucosamine-1-phosphate N-acetyltransferase